MCKTKSNELGIISVMHLGINDFADSPSIFWAKFNANSSPDSR